MIGTGSVNFSYFVIGIEFRVCNTIACLDSEPIPICCFIYRNKVADRAIIILNKSTLALSVYNM